MRNAAAVAGNSTFKRRGKKKKKKKVERDSSTFRNASLQRKVLRSENARVHTACTTLI